MKQIAILSDTHQPAACGALPTAVRELLANSDLIIHAGDLCDEGALTELQSFGVPVHAVLGNNDSALRGMLPETLTVEIEQVKIGLLHWNGGGSSCHQRMQELFPDHQAVVSGHTHVPEHVTDQSSGMQHFNPGSATCHRGRHPVHTMGIATVDGAQITFQLVELD